MMSLFHSFFLLLVLLRPFSTEARLLGSVGSKDDQGKGQLHRSSRDLKCVSLIKCNGDTKLCPDGQTTVYRDPCKMCLFSKCPDCRKLICPVDSLLCPDGVTYATRNPCRNCKFNDCPVFQNNGCHRGAPIMICAEEVQGCPDGATVVGRNPCQHCEFFQCP